MGWNELWGRKKPVEDLSYSGSAVPEYNYNNSVISEEEAMEIPTFQACVNIITNTIAQLDFKLIKHEDDDNIEIKDDIRLRYLNKEPNDEMTSMTFKKALIKDYLLYGEGIVKINRDLNDITSLYYIPAKDVETITKLYDGYKRYSEVTLRNIAGETKFNDYELMRILRDSKNGFTGLGILEENTEVLRTALRELKYSNDLFNNGAMPAGIVTVPKLTREKFSNFKSAWRESFQGEGKAGKTVIVEEGVKYQPVSFDPGNLQLSEMKKSLTTEICKIFNVPESMINNSANKYNSNERNNIFFLQYCLSPIISSFEATVNKNLLLESEKNDYEFIIDTTNIMKLTQSELVDIVSKEFNNGLISFNEARNKLNRNTIDSQDDYYSMSLGNVLYKYNKDEFIIPNTLDTQAEGSVVEENGNSQS